MGLQNVGRMTTRKSKTQKSKKDSQATAPQRAYKTASMDIPFLILVITLVIIGLVMLFSASYVYAMEYYGDSLYYIKRQLVFAVLGLIVMYIASRFDYHHFEKFCWPVYGASIALLILVLIIPVGSRAKRWLSVPVAGTFQPSEIAKLAVILACSVMIIKFGERKMKTLKYGVLYFGLMLVPIVVLLWAEPHLSAIILTVILAAIMMVVGGTRMRWFIGLGSLIIPVAIFAILYLGVDYWADRIAMWRDPFQDFQGDGYQVIQSLYAIASGGLLGRGLGNSRQKFLYLPEPQNDYIFSIVCEELGFVGATVIVILFALLVWRGFLIAMRAHDKFGALLTIGIVAQVGLQAMLNIAVVTNTLPSTGISLPFFSSGGTSLLMLLGEMGIVLSVSRRSRMVKE